MAKMERAGQLSRRDFLKSGSAMAVGAASLAAAGAPALLRGQNLNGRINVGVIGTGSRGCYLTRLMAEQEGVTVTDVCDIYPPHLQQGVQDSGNDKVRAHEQWEKLVGQQDVDVVVVAPPLFLHVPCSVAALQAGKHVFSEKSMALNMKQLKQMMAAAGQSDRVYLVGYQSRMLDSFAEAKSLVQGGAFGKITQFYLHYDRNQTWRKELEDPKWERVLNWRMYREYCGGILTELLTHQIDMMLDILGTMPVRGSCGGEIILYKDGREHHDSLMGYMEMEDGVLGVVSGTFCNARWGSCWAIHGTHGTIEFMGDAFRIFWEKETRHLQSVGVQHKFTKVKLGQSLDVSDAPITEPDKLVDYRSATTRNASVKAVEHFFDCVRNGTRPVMDAASASRPSLAAFMLYHSSQDGGRQYTLEEIQAMG
ncbi:MAG: Gfo/Idh/MocA family oxidoreductase [Candidatus Glassbacteria bacterium]|nr:Gfo/Idh/MocA family oxidoreductase [Candidatus Glassbacteria bacterium]